MKDSFQQSPDNAEQRAARLTAYALGQLNEAEAERLEAELRASPSDEQECAETKQLAEALSAAHANRPLPDRSSSLRQCVQERLAEPPRPSQTEKQRPRWLASRGAWISLTVAGVAAALLLLSFPQTTEQVAIKLASYSQPSAEGGGWAISKSQRAAVSKAPQILLSRFRRSSSTNRWGN